MAYRSAKFGDYWRAALAKDYEVKIEHLKYEGVRCLEDGAAIFSRGITAIVGGNGVGKSTLARATIEILKGANGVKQSQLLNDPLKGSQLQALVRDESGSFQLDCSISPDGDRILSKKEFSKHVIWLDPSKMALICQEQISGDPSFSDLLEANGSRLCSAQEVEGASYVVGKNYTKLEVWEIQDYGPLECLPYFKVEFNGISYGSEDMGRGELALLTSLWALKRAPMNSIMILEEPENHISARSQSALMNVLAMTCARCSLWVILTTHSSVIIDRLPKDNIRLLASRDGKSILISQPNIHDVASILGGGVAFTSLLMAEDECSKVLISTLCEKIDPDLFHQITIVDSRGVSKIDAALKNLPKPDNWKTRIIGVYDGDQRSENRPLLNWPYIYLPGQEAPEILLKNSVQSNQGRSTFATYLQKGEHDIIVALDASSGLNHHDWLCEVANILGLDKSIITRALCSIWIDSNEILANEFIRDLRKAMV